MLESFSHNGKTVMMAPASGFYNTPGLGKNQVRLAYVINNENIDAAMDCLEAALKVYPGRVD
jgi:aspartate aminotransferase